MSIKSKNEIKYYIQSKNTHLMNILEKDYYIELGIIDIEVLDKLLDGEKIEFSNLVNINLLTEGTGKITGDIENDVFYQLNYLINLRLKNSTCKFVLTCGTVKYYDDDLCEKYAPIVLIPFDFDYQHFELILSAEPIINPRLLQYLSKISEQNKTDSKKIIDTYSNIKISKVADIDKICYSITNEFKSSIDPVNYLTIVHVEYPDIVLEKDFMTIENSVNEMTEQTLFNRFFKEIKPIFPSNTAQKYVLLKANEGENFSVDGRLGSGKTHTIMNMIADGIAKDKTILYVNQDADNIFDIEKNLTYLGLSDYTYNLTKNLREIIKPEAIIDEIDISDVSSNILNDIFEMPKVLQSRINGFKICNILEYLAILKKKYPDINVIPLETVLENHEAVSLYSELVKIEEALTHIDLYANNIWHRLHTSHNNITTSDIISRITFLNKNHIELYKELTDFSKKYNIKLPQNATELYKLISHAESFSVVRPLPIWKDANTRQEVIKNLREIQSLVDINYNITKYYSEFIKTNYCVGRMKEIFDIIKHDNISIDQNYVTEDEEYINRILENSNAIILLSNDILDNLEKISNINLELMKIFGINSLDNHTYEFIINAEKFLSNNKYNSLIYDTYYLSQSIFTKHGDNASKAYDVYEEKRKNLPKYLKRIEYINREFLEIIMRRKNPDKMLAKLINTKSVKKDGKSISEVIENIRLYYIATKELLSNLSIIFGNKEFDDDFINLFINFYRYTSSLTLHEKAYFRTLLEKSNRELYRDKFLSKVILLLKDFIQEEYRTNSLCTTLLNYKIHIQDTNIYEKCNYLRKWNEYLLKVIKLKEEIKHIFLNKDNISFSDVTKLMKTDFQYQKVHKLLKEKESTYKANLGIYYYGLETVISEIGRTIEHYEEFIRLLNNKDEIDGLFSDKTFSSFLEGIKRLDQLYATWINSYRSFSVCFKGGQPEILTNSFDYNSKLFNQFINKSTQINHILVINELTEGFLDYKLKNLHDGIRSCKYGANISKYFIYSVLYHNYTEAIQKYDILKNLNSGLDIIDDYLKYEKYNCYLNLSSLIKNTEELKNIPVSNLNYYFNDYNKIIKSKNKKAKLFYADLDIFNSDLDLSLFDLVIMDDVHLSSSNKYHRLVECKQVVVFGDKLFQTSVSNALMKRLGESCCIKFQKRYLKANSKFNNEFSYDNQYIYNYDGKYDINMCESFDDFIEEIFKRFKKQSNRIINILIANEDTRRRIYTAIVSKLSLAFTSNEINNILCYNIRILNALNEGNRYVNDVLIYFDDFKELEESIKELVFKNFINVNNDVVLYFIKDKIDANNRRTRSIIKQSMGEEIDTRVITEGIVPYLKEALEKENINVSYGFGKFDLIIKDKKPIGVIVLDQASTNYTSFIDDYLYYHHEYEKRGWQIEIVYCYDLFNNFNETVEKITKELK